MVLNAKISTAMKKGKHKIPYFRQVQQELKKVAWTTKEELIAFTKIVIGATFLFGIGIYAADLIIKGILNVIAVIARWIGG